MDDQKFKYTDRDGATHTLDISVLHLAKTEVELKTAVTEFPGRLEPQLYAAHKAWLDASADNREHFVVWCDTVVELDGHRTYTTVGGGEREIVSYKTFVEAERFFKRGFLDLSLNSPLNLRMFLVWKREGSDGDFYEWLGGLPASFVCDVVSEVEGAGESSPKGQPL